VTHPAVPHPAVSPVTDSIVTFRPVTADDGATDGSSRTPRAQAESGTTYPESERVSLIIPTKNEATNIAWVLEQVPDCVDEIILVDGHSTDATLITARATRADVRIVQQAGTGKGDALTTGFLAATGELIVMIDADGSMAPQEIPRYLYFLSDGYDFVKGSRFMAGGGSRDITRLRRAGNRVLVGLVNHLFDAPLTDLCYGFVAFRRRYLDYLDLTRTGFEVESQLVISAVHAGLRIAEVPSLEMPRRYGHSNLRTFRDGARVLRTVLREHHSGLSGQIVQGARRVAHQAGLPSDQPSGPGHATVPEQERSARAEYTGFTTNGTAQ
jgi:hypothetical protein